MRINGLMSMLLRWLVVHDAITRRQARKGKESPATSFADRRAASDVLTVAAAAVVVPFAGAAGGGDCVEVGDAQPRKPKDDCRGQVHDKAKRA